MGTSAQVIEQDRVNQDAQYRALYLFNNGFPYARPRAGEMFRQISADGTTVVTRQDGSVTFSGPSSAAVDMLVEAFANLRLR